MDERIVKLREADKANNLPVLRDQTLELLLKIFKEKGYKTFLEIGVLTGLTGVALLTENKDAFLTGIEIDWKNVEKAKENYKLFGVEKRAEVFEGDALEIIPILGRKFDFILLDGPKGHYYEFLPYLKELLSDGGTLFSDDVLFHGYIEGDAPRKHNTIKKSLTAYLKAVTSDKDFKTEIYKMEDGVAVSEKICKR